jgi:dihydroorotase
MPNTDPPMDSPKVVESVLASAREAGLVDVIAAGSLTVGRAGAVPNDVEDLYRIGVRLFTDDGDSVADASVLEVLMRRMAALPGAVLAQHAEDSALTEDGHMHEGETSRRLGIKGMPSRAETDVVARDLELAARFGIHYHCQHVSTKETVTLIREAKKAGLAVTAEVTPHHLTFDDSSLADLDPDFKMYPPLRSAGDRVALIEALRSGSIDAVATDHAPHLPEEKHVAFSEAPRGVIGLETAAAATWMALDDRDRFFSALSTRPAEILGLDDQGQQIRAGVAANLVIFDPSATWVADRFRSKSCNSPHRGREMRGRVKATLHRGDIVFNIEEQE